MLFNLFDSVDLTSHLIFVKSWPTVSLCFYGQNKSKMLQNLFQALLNNPINQKRDPPPQKKKKQWRSKIGGKGGAEGRYDRSQRFNVFF